MELVSIMESGTERVKKLSKKRRSIKIAKKMPNNKVMSFRFPLKLDSNQKTIREYNERKIKLIDVKKYTAVYPQKDQFTGTLKNV
jgi:hypothetical protein